MPDFAKRIDRRMSHCCNKYNIKRPISCKQKTLMAQIECLHGEICLVKFYSLLQNLLWSVKLKRFEFF